MKERNSVQVFVAKIVLCKNKPVTIGRNPKCTYVLNEALVSGTHCKFNALPSGNGGIQVSCTDMSTNGTQLNGYKMNKTSMIVMDGDILEFPFLAGHRFVCHHITRDPDAQPLLLPEQRNAIQNVGPYVLTSHCLGSGSYATVHLAMDPAGCRQLACKTIKIKREQDCASLMKEVRLLQALNHPNINKVVGNERIGKSLHIFLQLCTAGDLYTYITTQPGFCVVEGEAKYIMYQVLKGLRYLHTRNISHRDIKPENLLLLTPGPYPYIQIADFGLARPKSYQETLNVAGTVSYLPPEGILALDNNHMGYVGMPSDCWSCGIILFIMLCGRNPFDDGTREEDSRWLLSGRGSSISDDDDESQTSTRTENHVKKRIVRGIVEFKDTVWEGLDEAKSLVLDLLLPDPRQRATVFKAFDHTWFSREAAELEREYGISVLGRVRNAGKPQLTSDGIP